MFRTVITGHSGCEGTPIDSVASVEKGIAVGAECVEVDVQLDESGILRLSHDARSDYSTADKLETAFARVRDAGVGINCDLKAARTLYPVLQLAEKYGLTNGQLIFSGSVCCNLLADNPEIAKKARVFLNVEEIAKYFYLGDAADFPRGLTNAWSVAGEGHFQEVLANRIPRIVEMAKSVGAAAINLPYRELTNEHIALFRSCGAELSLWTVNDEKDMDRLFRCDLLNITTTKPVLAMSVRAGIQK